jgi:hypothetical protein
VEETKELYDEWGLRGMTVVASAEFRTDGLAVESYTWVDKDSDVLDWYEVTTDPIPFLRRVPSQPMMAAVSRINFAEVWESLQDFDDVVESDSIPDFDESLDDASEEIGIDIEKDLIEQFNGNFVILVNNIQMTNNDAVILLQLSKPQEFTGTLTTLVEMIDEAITVNPSEESGAPNPELIRGQHEGVPYYTFQVPPMVEICFGVVEDHLVLTSSQLRFHSIVTGSGNFVDEIGNKDVKTALNDPRGSVFYIDFRKLADNLEEWAPMLGEEAFEIVGVLREMSELVCVGYFDDDGSVREDITFTGSKPDVWKRLLAAVLESDSDEEPQIDDIEDDN